MMNLHTVFYDSIPTAYSYHIDYKNQASLEGDEEIKQVVFWQLQATCSKLLLAREDVSNFIELMKTLREAVRYVDAVGLQECLDYVLFPFGMLLDAFISYSQDKAGPTFKAVHHDGAMEITLLCLKDIVSTCRLHDAEQASSLVQRLIVMLSCRAEFLSERPRAEISETLGHIFDKREFATGSDATGWLRKESFRPLIGNTLSILLNHAYNDVTNPSSINPGAQKSSLNALVILMRAISDADVLAFFVPGIATGLVKRILMQTRTDIDQESTSSRNSVCVSLCVQALEQLLVSVFADDVLVGMDCGITECNSTTDDLDVDVYDALCAVASTSDDSITEVAGKAPEDNMKELEAMIRTDKQALHVDINGPWVQVTTMRLMELFQVCLPKLCHHENSLVRLRLVQMSSHVLDQCSLALKGYTLFLDMILVLAQDTWSTVQIPAGQWLQDHLEAKEMKGNNAASGSLFEEFHKLSMVLQANEQKGREHALRLTSYILYSSPQFVCREMLTSSNSVDGILDVLMACFELDVSSALAIAQSPALAIGSSEITAATLIDPSREISLGKPFMPLSMKHITMKTTYHAVRGIVQSLAQAALVSDFWKGLQCTGTAFASIVDACLRKMRETKAQKEHAFSHSQTVRPWQVEASVTMIVLCEAFGGIVNLLEDRQDCKYGGSLTEKELSISYLKRVAVEILNAMKENDIWLLRTLHSVSVQPNVPMDEYPLNALAQHYCLNLISVIARCLKEDYSSDGQCMHLTLLPVIECMASNYQFVSSTAKNCIDSICFFSKYEHGIKDLIQKNIDYVVDGMCLRLRQPGLYPDAPKLFAALLKENGVAAALIPLLSEPSQHVIRGISIIHRREKPENVLSFVLCTQEIAKGTLQVAEESYRTMHKMCIEIISHKSDEDTIGNDEEENNVLHDQVTSINEISEYFLSRRQQKHARESTSIFVPLHVWDALMLSRNRLSSVALLMKSISDSICPLMVSKSLPVAVQSQISAVQALKALSVAHSGLEIFKNDLEELVKCEGQIPPIERHAIPTFLPSVHLLWLPLMGSLGDSRVPVLEGAIRCLKDVLLLAPSFLSRRFKTEAWPKIKTILRNGPPKQQLLTPGHDDTTSPDVLARIQRAVLHAIQELISALSNEDARSIFLPISRDLLEEILRLKKTGTEPSVSAVLQESYFQVASINPDVAWILLHEHLGMDPDIYGTNDLRKEAILPVISKLKAFPLTGKTPSCSVTNSQDMIAPSWDMMHSKIQAMPVSWTQMST